ncbi:hypothetical protein IKF92_00275 [Candidatus Saccharibacteria bacterium]|nr:hypothetical protein [Candidatus Saccharibacteria bacterium]
MEEEKKSKMLKLIGSLLVLLGVFAVIILLILTNGGETRTSDNSDGDVVSALVCRSGGRDDGFFKSEKANNLTNEVKVTFSDKTYDKIYYSYEGVYRATEVADEDEVRMHADYNIYMGDNNLSDNLLSPSYSVAKNKLHMTLIADDKSDLNQVTAVFFYVEKDDLEKFKNFSMGEMRKYYESKDFSCGETK